MDDQRRSEVRSFREVFALERRIYRIDRLRLNPTGVPVRGVAYAAVLLVVAQVADGLPVLGRLLGLAPWPLHDLIAPLALAGALTVLRIDGRPAHDALLSAARFLTGPRHLSRFARCAAVGAVWRPGPLIVIPDGSDGRLRAFVYRGPGRMLIGVAHTRRVVSRGRREALVVAQGAGAARRQVGVEVAAGGCVRVRGSACARR
jgi:hypothetical protein